MRICHLFRIIVFLIFPLMASCKSDTVLENSCSLEGNFSSSNLASLNIRWNKCLQVDSGECEPTVKDDHTAYIKNLGNYRINFAIHREHGNSKGKDRKNDRREDGYYVGVSLVPYLISEKNKHIKYPLLPARLDKKDKDGKSSIPGGNFSYYAWSCASGSDVKPYLDLYPSLSLMVNTEQEKESLHEYLIGLSDNKKWLFQQHLDIEGVGFSSCKTALGKDYFCHQKNKENIKSYQLFVDKIITRKPCRFLIDFDTSVTIIRDWGQDEYRYGYNCPNNSGGASKLSSTLSHTENDTKPSRPTPLPKKILSVDWDAPGALRAVLLDPGFASKIIIKTEDGSCTDAEIKRKQGGSIQITCPSSEIRSIHIPGFQPISVTGDRIHTPHDWRATLKIRIENEPGLEYRYKQDSRCSGETCDIHVPLEKLGRNITLRALNRDGTGLPTCDIRFYAPSASAWVRSSQNNTPISLSSNCVNKTLSFPKRIAQKINRRAIPQQCRLIDDNAGKQRLECILGKGASLPLDLFGTAWKPINLRNLPKGESDIGNYLQPVWPFSNSDPWLACNRSMENRPCYEPKEVRLCETWHPITKSGNTFVLPTLAKANCESAQSLPTRMSLKLRAIGNPGVCFKEGEEIALGLGLNEAGTGNRSLSEKCGQQLNNKREKKLSVEDIPESASLRGRSAIRLYLNEQACRDNSATNIHKQYPYQAGAYINIDTCKENWGRLIKNGQPVSRCAPVTPEGTLPIRLLRRPGKRVWVVVAPTRALEKKGARIQRALFNVLDELKREGHERRPLTLVVLSDVFEQTKILRSEELPDWPLELERSQRSIRSFTNFSFHQSGLRPEAGIADIEEWRSRQNEEIQTLIYITETPSESARLTDSAAADLYRWRRKHSSPKVRILAEDNCAFWTKEGVVQRAEDCVILVDDPETQIKNEIRQALKIN
uniref:Uncharacterized protein n=1 Tax=Candidatus Kentrum sp. MB TaxID=2138164 RepID=A0A450XYJ4_9GAMM|nr:MAG: hypothetical protein BECKMB1821G_GA0114241_106411 [Candidatus Kentron sp. MB]VFK34364.1 MAG: hypothetical protein BECKMB1821I_GA0114274_106911 [Candidatus Kentron sp. MB]VFK76680.1 MAG: hypothetical protein BECKMB1821H_GA0114242_106810 [Candidatus Kentron sp. MB]